MNEHEILNKEIGGVKIRDMSGITFAGLLAKKLNGVNAYSPEAQALSMMVSNPPIGRMSDESKVDAYKKLQKLNIEL